MRTITAHSPLYQCALKDWPAENYHAFIFHRGPIDPADQELVDVLTSAPAKLGVNLLVATVDTLEAMDSSIESLWEAQNNAATPWLVVTSPNSRAAENEIWSSALTTPSIGAVLTSPARQRIAEHLMEGHAAVWLLVESGDPVHDEIAIDMLTGTLLQFEKTYSTTNSDPQMKFKSSLTVPPHFSLIRVTRDDPAEDFLIKSLPRPPFPSPMPVAYPIFGRGRTLPALAGRRLNEESVSSACRQLLGNATNELRQISNGSELLLGASWESTATQNRSQTNLASKNQISSEPSSGNSMDERSKGRPASSSTQSGEQIDLQWLAGFAAAMTLAALVGFAIMKVWRTR